MGWQIQKNRLSRRERKDEVAAQRVAAGKTTVAEAAVVDFAALHRGLNEKKKAARVFVAFARELADGSA